MLGLKIRPAEGTLVADAQAEINHPRHATGAAARGVLEDTVAGAPGIPFLRTVRRRAVRLAQVIAVVALPVVGIADAEGRDRATGARIERRADAPVVGDGLSAAQLDLVARSDERRVGKGCVSTCRSRWPTAHKKKNKHI